MDERERFEENSGPPAWDSVYWDETKQKYIDSETGDESTHWNWAWESWKARADLAAEEVRELEDFARFMCESWVSIQEWALQNMTAEAIGSYPMIQGTRNQSNLARIGKQTYKTENIYKAVKRLTEENSDE